MDAWTKEALLWPEVWVKFRPLTSMGQRAKGALSPFMPGEELEWQETLERQVHLLTFAEEDPDGAVRIEGALSKLPDIESILLHLDQGGVPGMTEWFQLQEFLRWGTRLQRWVRDGSLNGWPDLDLTVWQQVISLLNPGPGSRIQDSFSINRGFDPRLETLTKQQFQLERRFVAEKERVADRIEDDYPISRNRDGEWIVDRGAAFLDAMRQDGRMERARETTFEVLFRALPSSEMVKITEEKARVEREQVTVTEEVFARLATQVHPFVPDLRRVLIAITHLDIDWARMRAAQSWQGVRPSEGDSIVIAAGRHPVMEQRLKEEGRVFTPVDVEVKRGVTVFIGPNMGGKTVALRTIGLIVSLGHYGFLVPAKECSMPLTPWVTAVIGDAQDVHAGLSTFGAEVVRLAKWVDRSDAGLLLLDEIGRGTNPVEGEALSVALTDHLAKGHGWVVHATHYRETIEIKNVRVYRTGGLNQTKKMPVVNAPETARQWLLDRMNFCLQPWQPSDGFPQEALTIAAQLGLPSEVIVGAQKRILAKSPGDKLPEGGAKPGKGDRRWKTD